MPDPSSEPLMCVACGDEHADPATATRIGISFVAAECAWTLRYPGMSAAEVIDHLEARLGTAVPGEDIRAVPGRIYPGAIHDSAKDDDPDKTTVMDAVSDDPAERVASNQFAEEVPCTVCGGDGELVTPDGARDGAVMCGRCNGTGRVLVAQS